MKVLRISSVFEAPSGTFGSKARRFDPVGGMQGHTADLSRGLDELGVAQTILTTKPPGVPARYDFGANGRVVRVGYPVKRMRQLWSLPAAALAPRLAAGHDLVHVHLGEDLSAVPIGLAAARIRDLPMVMTIHCSLTHTLKVLDARTFVLASLGGYLERLGVRAASAVVALTGRLAARLIRDGVDVRRVHVIRPAIDRDLLAGPFDRPLPNLDGPRVVFVGRLSPQKGIQTLLEATLLMQNTAARLILVGDGPERPEIEQHIDSLGVSDRVRIVGFVSEERAAAFIAHADVFVMPSIYEELGRALMDAMHLGVPIVGSRTGGIAELLRHGQNGLLVPPGDPLALARAIDSLVARPRLARNLGTAAREGLHAPDWNLVSQKMLDVYSQAIGERAERSLVHATG